MGPLSAAINGLVEREVRAFIASDEFADFWRRVNTRAQEALQRILTGDDSGAVSLKDDEVVLDVDEVINRVKERLVDRGLTIAENIPIPETDRQIVLMDAPQLRQARTIYAFSNPVAKWLLPIVGVLFLGAFLLARRRPRMTVWIGAIVAANALLLALMLSVGQQLFVNHLAGTAFGPASRVFYKTLLAYLERGQEVVLWLGSSWSWPACSPARTGTAPRSARPCPVVWRTSVSSIADTGLDAIASTGRWVAANAVWLRVVVVALGAVVLLWGNNASTDRLWWSLALVLVLLAGLQVLVGAGRERERGGLRARRHGDDVVRGIHVLVAFDLSGSLSPTSKTGPPHPAEGMGRAAVHLSGDKLGPQRAGPRGARGIEHHGTARPGVGRPCLVGVSRKQQQATLRTVRGPRIACNG